MKRFLFLAVCLLSLVGSGSISCQSAGSGNNTAAVPPDTVITLERTACRGTCPVYTLAVSADGKVVFNGKDYVKSKGTQEANIGSEKVSQIISEFNKINYYSLNDTYTQFTITDQSNVITSITTRGKSKTIKHYLGDLGAPRELTALEDKVDEIVGSSQWIK